MFVLIITTLVVALSFVYSYVINKRKFDLIDKFPGPSTQLIVGNAFNYAAKSPEGKLIYFDNKNVHSDFKLIHMEIVTYFVNHFQM